MIPPVQRTELPVEINILVDQLRSRTETYRIALEALSNNSRSVDLQEQVVQARSKVRDAADAVVAHVASARVQQGTALSDVHQQAMSIHQLLGDDRERFFWTAQISRIKSLEKEWQRYPSTPKWARFWIAVSASFSAMGDAISSWMRSIGQSLASRLRSGRVTSLSKTLSPDMHQGRPPAIPPSSVSSQPRPRSGEQAEIYRLFSQSEQLTELVPENWRAIIQSSEWNQLKNFIHASGVELGNAEAGIKEAFLALHDTQKDRFLYLLGKLDDKKTMASLFLALSQDPQRIHVYARLGELKADLSHSVAQTFALTRRGWEIAIQSSQEVATEVLIGVIGDQVGGIAEYREQLVNEKERAHTYFDQVLKPVFRLRPSRDDGDCLYHSIGHSLGMTGLRARQLLSEYMRSHKEELMANEAFRVPGLAGVPEYQFVTSSEAFDREMEKVAEHAKGLDDWGSEPHIAMLAWCFDVPVYMYGPDYVNKDTGEQFRVMNPTGSGPRVYLFRNGINHWDRLELREA